MKFLIILAILLPINAHAFLSGGSSGGGGGAVDSVNGQTGVVTLGTDEVAQGVTNLYYSDALCRAAVLTGYSSAAGTVAATDTILQAFNKLNGNDGLDAKKASNLSDLASASDARTNLGLGSAAVLASSAVAQTANNLSDLASASTARTNLGLGSSAVLASTAFLNTAGVSGGQTASGGTASGDDLTLASTTNATKGDVNIGLVQISEADTRLCVGLTGCTYRMHFRAGADSFAHGFALDHVSGGANSLWRFYPDLNGTFSLANPNQSVSIFAAVPSGLIVFAGGANTSGATVTIANQASQTTKHTLAVSNIASQTGDLLVGMASDNTTKVFSFDSAGTQVTAAGNESTGAGTALLGANSPASTVSAPYTWIKMKTSDGSTVFVPAWK